MDASSTGPTQLGPYVITGELGRGGMGVVYRATRADLQREFALKVVHAGPACHPETIARFQREAQAAARLAGHPGIVGVHDIGSEDAAVWFAMDLVDGRSLDQEIGDEGLEPRRAAAIALEVARALAHAHAEGVLHRDVKPGNIMLPKDGGPARVTDFGLAKVLNAGPEAEKLTASGSIVGTAGYMPPEQVLARPLDARADVYALGATLYDALAGQPPFRGSNAAEVMSRAARQPPPPLRAAFPHIPRDLETIVLRCLEKQPEQRYADMNALADDLEAFLDGRPIAARPIGGAAKAWRRIQRNPAPWVVGVIGLAAVAGVAVIRPGPAVPAPVPRPGPAPVPAPAPAPTPAPAPAPADEPPQGDQVAYNDSTVLSACEVYDPVRDTWTPVWPMRTARRYPALTPLPDGRVLVTGGARPSAGVAAAETFDPSTGRWSEVAPMRVPRRNHLALRLKDGRVLVAFGATIAKVGTAKLELYDRHGNSWRTAQDASQPRLRAHGLVLRDGRVLLAGGEGLDADGFTTVLGVTELFHPASATLQVVAPLGVPRRYAALAALPDGGALLAGGNDGRQPIRACERFDAATGRWTAAPAMRVAREYPAHLLLEDGRVLVAGGRGLGSGTSRYHTSAEIFDPSRNGWTPAAPLTEARYRSTAVLLKDGRVLVAGGWISGRNELASCEIYDPVADRWSKAAPMRNHRRRHAMCLLEDGRVLVAGGQRTP